MNTTKNNDKSYVFIGEVLSQTELFEDVYMIVFKNNKTNKNDAVMVWNKDGNLKSSADEILTTNAENRKAENKTETVSVEIDIELMIAAEEWCKEKQITLEQFMYAYFEFCVQAQHRVKISEIAEKIKNEQTIICTSNR